MPPKYYAGLCAIAKDETPFLREWVGYHHFIGFEKIYVYDNESEVPAHETLAEFYDLGVCDTYRLWGLARQLTAYNLCLRDHGGEFEWLAFFDIDEFLCLKQDDDVRVLLRDYENCSALSVNWDTFSSSGHISPPQDLVIRSFLQSLGYSQNCKCIVRPARVEMPFTAHHFLYTEGIAVNADRVPAYGAYAPVAVDKICLNHYPFRSQYDYERKLAGSDATYGAYNPRSHEAFYQQANAETEEHADMLPLADYIEAMSTGGAWRKRHNVALSDLAGKKLTDVLSIITRHITANNLATAEVLFAMSYGMFKKNRDFMLFGISLSCRAEKFSRALSLAEELTHRHPEPPAYVALLECLILAGRRKEAIAVRDFLQFVVRYEDDAANRQSITAALQKESVRAL